MLCVALCSVAVVILWCYISMFLHAALVSRLSIKHPPALVLSSYESRPEKKTRRWRNDDASLPFPARQDEAKLHGRVHN
ncbi:hypothetical protein BGZ63DRAFT_383410, partial [Mariannaea sp. PMI_226]